MIYTTLALSLGSSARIAVQYVEQRSTWSSSAKLSAGPVVNSYAVQDKVQEAELDPTMVIEDELFAVEAWEPCLVCGGADDVHEIMYCDGCDKAIHVFCAGFDEAPDVWYCETCFVDLETDIGLPGVASAMRRRPRRRAPATQRTRRNNEAIWARVWQEVSRRLDLDLDFPFDDEIGDQRTEEQRREFARWQRRFEVANSQGAANTLRGIANARLQSSEPALQPEPESQEELRAWNAFDKARESQDAPASIRRRKRKRTASPASSHGPESVEQQQQKRPRLRRPRVATEQPQDAESSHAVERSGGGPTFLSSLLHEVESKPISAGSPGTSDYHNGQLSPRDSSPGGSSPSSGYATPRALSVTPPPQRPISPPLSSTIIPLSSPIAQHSHLFRQRPCHKIQTVSVHFITVVVGVQLPIAGRLATSRRRGTELHQYRLCAVCPTLPKKRYNVWSSSLLDLAIVIERSQKISIQSSIETYRASCTSWLAMHRRSQMGRKGRSGKALPMTKSGRRLLRSMP